MSNSNIIPSEVHQALNATKERCVEIKGKGLAGYALSYLNALDQAYVQYGIEGVKTQILYILNNLSWWRGPEAREAKKILKKFATS